MRFISSFVLFCTLGTFVSAAEPPALKLLFLGDNGHHQPARRFADLAPALKKRNIELTYSDDASKALTAGTLAQYDGLVLYANTDRITPEEETA
jgi:hypothetical protein